MKSKTILTAIAGIVAAVAPITGVTVPNEVYIGLGSLMAIFMRLGVKKGEFSQK